MLIDEIGTAIKSLLSLKSEYAKARRDKRERIAQYLLKISECCEEVYEHMKTSFIPYMACSKMATYAEMLPEVVGPVIGSERAKKLSVKLLSLYKFEDMATEIFQSPDKDLQLARLLKMSGTLRASADSLLAI